MEVASIKSWIVSNLFCTGSNNVTPEYFDDAMPLALSLYCETLIDERKTGEPKHYAQIKQEEELEK